MTNPTPAEARAREAVVHDLKVWPEFFAALWDGSKVFEWRKDDRDYRVGDVLILREWSEATGYTGRGTKRTIGYILRDRMGMPSGFAVLGFNETARVDAEWRARVEGAKQPHVECWVQASDGCHCGATSINAALDALLTAVARDREG